MNAQAFSSRALASFEARRNHRAFEGLRTRLDASRERRFHSQGLAQRDARIPLESLRDLVGICRALYAAWRAERVGPIELEELGAIGKDLSEALRLARKTEPGTLGHRAAWSRAEEATRRLGHLVGKLEPLHPMVEIAAARALGARPAQDARNPTLEQREAKKKHNRMRN